MAIPSSVPNTKEGYLAYLTSQVNLASQRWTHYGWAVSHAYAKAYESVKDTLGKVKKAQEAHRQADNERMAFALSLLTVGIAGPIAGGIGRSFTVPGGTKLAEDAVKQVLQRAQQRMFQPAIDVLSPEKTVSVDVFAPSDTTPEEYTTSLQENISFTSTFLAGILDEMQWGSRGGDVSMLDLKSGGQISFANAKFFIDILLTTSFMAQAPPLEISSNALKPKAALALWIGWALARDAMYWDAYKTNADDYYKAQKAHYVGPGVPGKHNTDAFWEQYDWEPVRLAVIALGVPADRVTATLVMNNGRGGFDEHPGLYMRGFMHWAASRGSMELLFSGDLPKNALGFEMVNDQMRKRLLGPWNWIDACCVQ